MNQGTCLQTYIPIRREPRSGAEMLTSLIFGESYIILEKTNDWLKILTDFDHYEGWMSLNTFAEYQEFNVISDTLFVDAVSKHQKIMIPCGANIPESGVMQIDGEEFTIEKRFKTNHHLPLPLRLAKTAQSFLNTPYLWGGRTFMGIDCSGFMQVVIKSCGIALPRDTYQQVQVGVSVEYGDLKACDMVFFSKPDSEKVSHVGLMLDKRQVIHSSGKVKISDLKPEGIMIDGKLAYLTHDIKRII